MNIRQLCLLLALYLCIPSASAESLLVGQGTGPKLSAGAGDSVILSYIEPGETKVSLVYHVVDGNRIGEKHTVASGDNWFVNWADFPSVVALTDTKWAAHWLVRQPEGGYAYDIWASVSENAGEAWGNPFLLHHDGTPSEHGFVSLFPYDGKLGAVWLDGRNTSGGHGNHGSGGMTMRGAVFSSDGKAESKQIIDALTCDCCQTDVSLTSSGPVATYRDRSDANIRDIYVSRFVDGKWQPGTPVHDDGWQINGCPVNGPVIEATGAQVAVTWFTAAGDQTIVKTAWSADAGRSFAPPVVLDANKPLGYVGSTAISENSVVSSWVCRADDDSYALCYRKVSADGNLGETFRLAEGDLVSRMSVPQLALVDGRLLFAWTSRAEDGNEIRVTRVSIPN